MNASVRVAVDAASMAMFDRRRAHGSRLAMPDSADYKGPTNGALASGDPPGEAIDGRVGETPREPFTVERVERDRDGEPKDASGGPAEDVGEVVHSEVQAAEGDQPNEHDGSEHDRDAYWRRAPAAPGEIRERSVSGCGEHGMAARERVGVQMEERNLGAWTMKGKFQNDIEQFAARQHDREERNLCQSSASIKDDASDE